MKKILLLLIILTSVSFANDTDGYAGASLSRRGTSQKYKELRKMADEAIKNDDWFLREQSIDEIEYFIKTIKSYEDISSKSAKRSSTKYAAALQKKLPELKKVDGMGGASLDPSKMMPRYKYIVGIIDEALKTGKNQAKAIEEAEDMLNFIKKWKAQQSGGAKSFLNRYEETLTEKLEQLKK